MKKYCPITCIISNHGFSVIKLLLIGWKNAWFLVQVWLERVNPLNIFFYSLISSLMYIYLLLNSNMSLVRTFCTCLFKIIPLLCMHVYVYSTWRVHSLGCGLGMWGILWLFDVHPILYNINLCNVTRSLISWNLKEWKFSAAILIVTFLSLISHVLPWMQTTKEVNPHPRIAPHVCTSWTKSIFWEV